MGYLRFTLALVLVICVTGSVRAWDLGVVTKTQIKLFSNGTADTATDIRAIDMAAVAYDPIKKDIYVGDTLQEIGCIFRIKTTGKTAYNSAEPIVAKQTADVYGIAFDYTTSTLYWATPDGILYVRVPDDEITAPLTGQVLLRIDQGVPQGIAIDVRRGYLYWANFDVTDPTVERSRLDGSGRRVLVRRGLTCPTGVAVDAESNTLYWTDQRDRVNYSIGSMDLRDNGTRHAVVRGTRHQPYAVALDDRHVYWSDCTSNAVWTVPKNSTRRDVSPTLVTRFGAIMPMGLFVPSGGDAGTGYGGNDVVVFASSAVGSSLRHWILKRLPFLSS